MKFKLFLLTLAILMIALPKNVHSNEDSHNLCMSWKLHQNNNNLGGYAVLLNNDVVYRSNNPNQKELKLEILFATKNNTLIFVALDSYGEEIERSESYLIIWPVNVSEFTTKRLNLKVTIEI